MRCSNEVTKQAVTRKTPISVHLAANTVMEY
jgi:hypothetical protein